MKNGCNAAADEGDMERVTRIVNGPAKLHLKERVEFYEHALSILV
jgi:predicted chitinase